MQSRWRVVAAGGAAAAVAGYAPYRLYLRRRGWRLRDRLTIILCTSPTKTNPSTALIEETVGSMRRYAPALAECRVLISCDGYKIREQPRYRSGQVTAEGGEKYWRRGTGSSTRADRGPRLSGMRYGFGTQVRGLPGAAAQAAAGAHGALRRAGGLRLCAEERAHVRADAVNTRRGGARRWPRRAPRRFDSGRASTRVEASR